MIKDDITFEKLSIDDLGRARNLLLLCFGDTVGVRQSLDIDFGVNGDLDHSPYQRHSIIAKDDQRIVGLVSCKKMDITANTAGLSWLAVDPEYQHRGIAHALCVTIEKFALEHIFNNKAGTINMVSRNDPAPFIEMGYQAGVQNHAGLLQLSKIINPLDYV